jgi:autophagy-related protein 9
MNSLFTYKLLLFLEELASVVLTPFILAYSLPRCAGVVVSTSRAVSPVTISMC